MIWFIIATLTACALGLGFLLGRRHSPHLERMQQLETSLQDQQHQHEDYRYHVEQHFTESAELLKQLSNNYRAICQHFAAGAYNLCQDTAAAQQIHALSRDQNSQPTPTSQPIDYALDSDMIDSLVFHEPSKKL